MWTYYRVGIHFYFVMKLVDGGGLGVGAVQYKDVQNTIDKDNYTRKEDPYIETNPKK